MTTLLLAAAMLPPIAPLLDHASLNGALTGVSVRNAAGEVVFEQMGDTRLVPASNQKILSVLYALEVLGPDYRGEIRVWDTEYNNGVLIYLLMADNAIELVADRGLMRVVPQAAWDALVARMVVVSRSGESATALVTGQVTSVKADHFLLVVRPASPWWKSARFWSGAAAGAAATIIGRSLFQ